MNPIDPGLRQVLDERGEGVRVVADLAERAIARDRSNRRRELGGTALAAGLVLAVAVPIAWSAVRPTGGRPLPVGPSQSTTAPTGLSSAPTGASSAPTPTSIPTLTADGSPAPVTARFATGAPTDTTTVPYLLGDVIHDGSRTIRIEPEGRWGTLARVSNDGWLVTDADTLVSTVLDAQGQPLTEITGTTRVSASGLLIAAADSRGTLRAYDNLGNEMASLAAATCACSSGSAGIGYEAVGVVNDTVYANRGDVDGAVAWDVSTGQTRRLPFRLAVVDASTETAAVLTPGAEPRTSCLELRDLLTGRARWRLCGPLVPRAFSANGLYLLATGYSDGVAESQLNPDGTFRYGGLVVVRTSDGAIVLEGGAGTAGAGGSPVSYRMGDDSRLVVQVGSTSGLRDLQRCTLEGECAVVAPGSPRTVDIPEGEDPYVLSDN